MTTTTILQTAAKAKQRRVPIGYLISLAILGVAVLCAAFGPLLVPGYMIEPNLSRSLLGVNQYNWLGTDAAGRDNFWMLVIGTRLSLLLPLVVVGVSTVLGVIVGLIAGWRGGWLDSLLSRVIESVLAFPALLLAILAIAIFGKNVWVTAVAMAIAMTPGVARLTRGLIISEKVRPYTAAYQVQGFRPVSIALLRVLPNVFPIILGQAVLNYGFALIDLVGLSFLGLGVQPPAVDWGTMISEGAAGLMTRAYLPVLVPSIAVVVLVVAFNNVGTQTAEVLRSLRRDHD